MLAPKAVYPASGTHHLAVFDLGKSSTARQVRDQTEGSDNSRVAYRVFEADGE